MSNAKGRRGKLARYKAVTGGGTFSMLRHDLVKSPEFINLSPSANKVLTILIGTHTTEPNNNGNLSAPLPQSYERFGMSDKTYSEL
ncbi:hypothetical protein A4G19_14160 [Pasteurellaceae bacterium Macca]|nr:hypothetical protein [Pasteurellaceae bacterium Macca]